MSSGQKSSKSIQCRFSASSPWFEVGWLEMVTTLTAFSPARQLCWQQPRVVFDAKGRGVP